MKSHKFDPSQCRYCSLDCQRWDDCDNSTLKDSVRQPLGLIGIVGVALGVSLAILIHHFIK